MIVLGWHGGIRREYEDMIPGWSAHDGAAVLLKDGEVVAATEEERLNRIKHSNFFPAESIRQCLNLASIDFDAVDLVAMNFAERPLDIFPPDVGLPSVDLFLEEPRRTSVTVRELISEMFRREFDADVSGKLFFCNHHVAHLWSAYASSGFPTSLAVSIDGKGDALSGMVAHAQDGRLEILREYGVEQSLGNLYSDMIRFVGYKRFDEYKVMGLAPYGDPGRFRQTFQHFYRLLSEGQYELKSRSERWAHLVEAGILPHARRIGQPFDTVHKDFAASLQEMLEIIFMHVLEYFRVKTDETRLCLTGGVAHNATLNGRILYQAGFDSVFVHPAAHDAGGALGAAIAAYRQSVKASASSPLAHVFWGKDIGSSDEVAETLGRWGDLLTFEKLGSVTRSTAGLLADGKVVGWVQGRSEFGPRALGHRSILADPRPPENTARINSMIKKRESFRPFAPSICEEEMAGLLEMPPTKTDFSYMTFVLRVRDSSRLRLAAATHVDGTARIQSVSKSSNPQYWELIHEFGRLTGVPALLNTSFNNNAEPIVDSVHDAIVCFLTTGLDALVVGEYLVHKRRPEPPTSAYTLLRLSLAHSRKLVRRTRPEAGAILYSYYIEATASRHFVEAQIEVSKDLFHILLRADGKLTLGELLSGVGGAAGAVRDALTEEIVGLWSRRAVVLQP